MTSSSPAPKLPLWVFFATDVVLLGAAGWMAYKSPEHMPETTVIAITVCVVFGAIAGLVPLIVHYERQKNETLDDRQRALEALARTVSSSADQISIAASGLHEIADLAQRNLRHAEQLPHKLQEKIAEFQAQLANANDTEKEELEKELEELRASESERLQSVSDKVARTAQEMAKLETAVHQHVTAANEALGKLSFGTAGAIGKAQAAAEQALAQARTEAARALGEASGHAMKTIEGARASAVADLAAEFDRQIARLRDVATQVAQLLEKLEAAAKAPPAPASTPEPSAGSAAADPSWSVPLEALPVSTTSAPSEATPASANAPADAPAPDTPVTAPNPPPKRPRKRREEPPAAPAEGAVESPAPSTPPTAEPPAPASEIPALSAPEAKQASAAPEATEPAATNESSTTPASTPPGVAAATEPAATPAPTLPPAPEQTGSTLPASAPEESATSAATPIDTPRRKRTPKREDVDQPHLGLDLDEDRENGAPQVERVLSSDGATRLIVTAYIGIGNRLFIRGTGPGLSWDKGVPLQFVSIGKWRWETNDAASPVQVKLLKNDEYETVGLGELTIEPGYQHEVTATF